MNRLRTKLGAKRSRVEEAQLNKGHWQLWDDVLYLDGCRAVPRSLTSSIFGEGSEESVRAKWLRTYFVAEAHERGRHDHQLCLVNLRRLGVTWPDLVKGVRYIIDYDGPFGEDNGTHPEVSRHGKDYLRGPEASDFERGFALLKKHGLSYDLQCAPAQLPAAAALLARGPRPVIVDGVEVIASMA